jgi:hypothetical protein
MFAQAEAIGSATIEAVTDDKTTGKLLFRIDPKGVYYMCYKKSNGWGPLMGTFPASETRSTHAVGAASVL